MSAQVHGKTRQLMPRPRPTKAHHFMHVAHLPTIAQEGLLCDAAAQEPGLLTTEVGNQGVKGQRRLKHVDAGPGGVVADYVPFYFTARNLMLFHDDHGSANDQGATGRPAR